MLAAMLAAPLLIPFFAAAQDKPAVKEEPQITVQGVKGEEQTKARLRADALLARCTIKPVMTDEEIAQCSEAHRVSRAVAEAERKSGTATDSSRPNR
jgi:hypothetical protein